MAKKPKKEASIAKKKNERQEQDPPPISLNEIEERLTASILKATLALHLLKNSRKPASALVSELFDIEAEVGHFVAVAIQGRRNSSHPSLKGALAATLSFMPLPSIGTASQGESNSAPKLSHPQDTKKSKTRKRH